MNKNSWMAMVLCGTWINFSEFVRNEWLFKQAWIDKYHSLGLEFPSTPANGVVWALWGFIFAGCLSQLVSAMGIVRAGLLGWMMGFFLMWLVVGNMGVLPFSLLWIALPWSVLEVVVAVLLIRFIQYDWQRR